MGGEVYRAEYLISADVQTHVSKFNAVGMEQPTRARRLM